MQPAEKRFIRKLGREIITRWEVRPDRQVALAAAVGQRAIRWGREECGDLPGRAYTVRYCDLSAQQATAIIAIIRGADWTGPGGQVVPARVLATGQKLAQVPGGVLLDPAGAVRFDPCPKADLLLEALAELAGRKVVVYHTYVEEGRLLAGRLRAAGVGFAELRGEIAAAARSDGLARFAGDPACRVLLAHPRSGGVGLNLQHADAMIFYSNGLTGAAARAQAEGRIWRQGQSRPCLFIDLVARGSLDEARLDRVKDQRGAMEAVLAWVQGKHKSS